MKKLLSFIFAALVTMSCSDEITPMYSQEHIVRCDLVCAQYPELFNVVGNYGQFVRIRLKGTSILLNEKAYALTAEQGRYFQMGLGGLIVGANYEGELRAYDLACPNCKRADKRLTISDNGIAQCPGNNCRIKYNLNSDGVIIEKPEGCTHTTPRGLYRYRISYDGQSIHAYN